MKKIEKKQLYNIVISLNAKPFRGVTREHH